MEETLTILVADDNTYMDKLYEENPASSVYVVGKKRTILKV